MINRNVTGTDIKVYLSIIFILFLGFGTNVLFIIEYKYPLLGLIMAPITAVSIVMTPKAAIIISLIIFMGYASLRFFRSWPMFHITVFGTMLVAAYFNNVQLTRELMLFPVVAIIAVPQLINVLFYVAFNRNKEGR